MQLFVDMRPEHRVTLPASVVRQAKLRVDDCLVVGYANGSIIITPEQAHNLGQRESVMAKAKTSFEIDEAVLANAKASLVKNGGSSNTRVAALFATLGQDQRMRGSAMNHRAPRVPLDLRKHLDLAGGITALRVLHARRQYS